MPGCWGLEGVEPWLILDRFIVTLLASRVLMRFVSGALLFCGVAGGLCIGRLLPARLFCWVLSTLLPSRACWMVGNWVGLSGWSAGKDAGEAGGVISCLTGRLLLARGEGRTGVAPRSAGLEVVTLPLKPLVTMLG